MTQLETAILEAITEDIRHHGADFELQIKALQSALDDLCAEQTRLQLRERRLVRWLRAIDESSTDHEMAKAMARAALRGDREPP